ncbi:MAG: hypothetical protein ACK5CL_04980 [Sphingomonadales bacterium]|jgi:uncharacterized membrane protein
MRKIILAFLFASGCIITLSRCKKSADSEFDHSVMRPWFDKNCKSCHGTGGSNRGAWSYDANNYESSIKKHISHIYQEVYINKSMPPSGLSQAERDQFKAWYDAGYPAK